LTSLAGLAGKKLLFNLFGIYAAQLQTEKTTLMAIPSFRTMNASSSQG
jgi:hypothetical protein